MNTNSPFNSGSGGRRRMGPSGRKGPKGQRSGQKGRGGKRGQAEPLIEQPISDSIGTVPCQLCGHPVDPKRMHPHMVRFHGAAIRSRGAWDQKPQPS